MTILGTRPRAMTPYAVSVRGAFVVTFMIRSSQMGTIAIVSPYLLDRGVPVALLGVVMVCSALGVAGAQVVVGRLVDRFGAWHALVGGCLVAVLGTLVFVSSDTWPVMAVSYLIASGGMAAAGNALRTTIGLGTPQEEHEKVFGKLNSVGTAGALVGPLLVGLVVLDGTAAAPWFAIGALSLATVTSLFTRRPAVRPDSGGEEQPDAAGALGARDIIRSIAPIVALVTTTATMYGVYAVAWGVYLRVLGATDLVIAWSFAATMLPVVLLSPYASKVLPNVRRWALVGAATMLLGVLAFVYALTTVIWLAIVISVVEGVLMAVCMPLTYALITKHAPKEGLGRAFGVAGAADAVSSGIGTSIAGALIAMGGVAFSFRIAGAYCVLGTAVALVWWWRRGRRPAGPRVNAFPSVASGS